MIITNKSNLLRGQGLGDATTPLVCAIIFNILNFFGDHIFIRRYNLGIVGSALATLLSQTLALILMMVQLNKKVPIRWFQLKYSSFIDYLARYGKAGMYLLARSMARVGAFSYCSRRSVRLELLFEFRFWYHWKLISGNSFDLGIARTCCCQFL